MLSINVMYHHSADTEETSVKRQLNGRGRVKDDVTAKKKLYLILSKNGKSMGRLPTHTQNIYKKNCTNHLIASLPFPISYPSLLFSAYTVRSSLCINTYFVEYDGMLPGL